MSFKCLPPVFDEECKVLILGSFPSVKSRESNFYYGNPQNRFWKLFREIFGLDEKASPDEKAAFLLKKHIAVWDVVAECEIKGSSDGSLKCLAANHVDELVAKSKIQRIYCNGALAFGLLKKNFPHLAEKAVRLPSTSPANVRFDRAAWLEVLKSLKS